MPFFFPVALLVGGLGVWGLSAALPYAGLLCLAGFLAALPVVLGRGPAPLMDGLSFLLFFLALVFIEPHWFGFRLTELFPYWKRLALTLGASFSGFSLAFLLLHKRASQNA